WTVPGSPFQLEGGWGVGVTPDGTYPLAPFLQERGICTFIEHNTKKNPGVLQTPGSFVPNSLK
ncbi:MAG: hypothetical protein KAU23_00655, partial [Anaerolineales bacterium]|nr:hypothetical protein [Anaerolineales bacterium]